MTTRKGFKFTVSKQQTVSTEEVPFDEIDTVNSNSNRVTSSDKMKLKEKVESNNISGTNKGDSSSKSSSSNNNNNNSGSSSAKKRSRKDAADKNQVYPSTTDNVIKAAVVREQEIDAKKTKKSYYPSVEYHNIRTSPTSSTCKDMLSTLIVDICENEIKQLNKHFDQKILQSNNGKDMILNALTDILNELPKEIKKSCPNDIIFAPEIASSFSSSSSSKSKDNDRLLLNKLSALQAQSILLEKYENNIENLCKDYDIWIDRPDDILQSQQLSSSASKSNNVSEVSTLFEDQLKTLDNKCNEILLNTAAISTAMTNARAIQGNLYDAYQKARLPVTDSTKGIMKVLQKSVN